MKKIIQKDKLKELSNGHRARVREKVLKGNVEDFTDVALLEFLLFYSIPRIDTVPLARILLAHFGSFEKVLSAREEELNEIQGVGESTIALFKVLPEILKRYRISKTDKKGIVLNKRSLAVNYISPYIDLCKNEELHMLCLDGAFRLIAHECVEKGTVNKINLQIRKICELALKHGTTSVLLVHNHPSGIAKPSVADDEATAGILKALNMLDIALIDHIIITANESFSYKDQDRFKDFMFTMQMDSLIGHDTNVAEKKPKFEYDSFSISQ